MTSYLDKEANNSEDIDVIQQVGGGLLNGMSHVLEVLTKNEAADTKHIDGLENNKKRLEKFRTKLNKVRRHQKWYF